MAGMLQILTYLLAFYLVVKGVSVLQIALASPKEDRALPIAIGGFTVAACIVAAVGFSQMQDEQARSLSSGLSSLTSGATP